ncbi:MAG: 50S ribosomal protein L11 methyltransferase [Acidobacteriota bacterium]
MAEREWPALRLDAAGIEPRDLPDQVAAALDDLGVVAIQDLAEWPLPPGGLWDPTCAPVPEPPPAPLAWRVFFESSTERDRARAALADRFPALGLVAEDVPDDDWAARSQRELTSVRAGCFIVAPPWDQPDSVPPGTWLITIEPSMGFGTGHHATTRLCLEALSTLDVSGRVALDLGTGSGVLAIAAALAGARAVTAIDADADAIAAARHSASLNRLPVAIAFLVGDFRRGAVEPADVVLANLTGGLLTTAALEVRRLVAAGGRLVLSGFDADEAPRVRRAFADLALERTLAEGGWTGLVLRA